MAGFKNLPKKDIRDLGRTSRLYHEGKTPEMIADIVKRPIEKILEWIEIVKKADENRAKNNG